MFKRAFGLLMLAAALGACDQDPTGPELEEAPAPAYAVGGASELKNQIVFVDRKPGPASEIWIMRPDGSNRRLLTRGAHPDVSPDGRRVAFTSYYTSLFDARAPIKSEIRVINVDGTNEVVLTPKGMWDSEPKWSPDGEQILFRHNTGGVGSHEWFESTGDYHLMTATGANRRRIPEPENSLYCQSAGCELYAWGFAGWSTVGPFFWADDSVVGVMLRRYSLASGEHLRVTDRLTRPEHMDVSRWGNVVGRYAWSGFGGSGVDVFFSEGGSDAVRERLLESPYFRWSPDAGQILYEVELNEGTSELWTIDTNGCNPTPVGLVVPGTARWSRTGGRILFEEPADGELYAVRADGSTLTNLTPGSPDAPDFFTQRPPDVLPVTLPLCGGGEIGT